MSEILGMGTFLISVALVLWVASEMLASVLPPWVSRGARRLLWLFLDTLEAFGAWVEGLVVTLWQGRRATPPARPLSTVSPARPPALMSRSQDDTPDPRADRGLSGLSAADLAPAAPGPGDLWIESLDTGSRQRAVALLVRDGWSVGKIRKVLTGDSGAIGLEAAEARRRLGLAEPEEPRKPVSGLERGAERYAGEPAP